MFKFLSKLFIKQYEPTALQELENWFYNNDELCNEFLVLENYIKLLPINTSDPKIIYYENKQISITFITFANFFNEQHWRISVVTNNDKSTLKTEEIVLESNVNYW